ncbi:MAG: hypothetical protein ACLRWM_07310 [Streptococcus sp.]
MARQIGKGLNLNLDLIEAAALGHDLGLSLKVAKEKER